MTNSKQASQVNSKSVEARHKKENLESVFLQENKALPSALKEFNKAFTDFYKGLGML